MPAGAVFDEIAHQYDDTRGGEARGKRFAKEIVPILMREAKVLELGVGTGVVAGAIEAAGFDIVGIDVSREMLKHAVARVSHLVWADMNRLPFVDAYFGSAYAVWVMHLADDIPAFLGEIRRVLVKGGCFLNCSAANRIGAGGSSASVAHADSIGKIVLRMQEALSGPELIVDSPEKLGEYGRSAGFVLEKVVDVRHEYTTSASITATHLEQRGMSTLQRATPEQMRDIVLPAIAELRGLPNPDAEARRSTLHQIAVLRAV